MLEYELDNRTGMNQFLVYRLKYQGNWDKIPEEIPED